MSIEISIAVRFVVNLYFLFILFFTIYVFAMPVRSIEKNALKAKLVKAIFFLRKLQLISCSSHIRGAIR